MAKPQLLISPLYIPALIAGSLIVSAVLSSLALARLPARAASLAAL
jgi:hypothetical protein